MIVYVETNFVLELVLEQEGAHFVEGLVSLVKTSKIDLTLPAVCLVEPFWSIEGKERLRRPFIDETNVRNIRDLGRSKLHQNLFSNLDNIIQELKKAKDVEDISLNLWFEELLNYCRVIEMNKLILEQANVYRKLYSLALVDAIVYASVIQDLKVQSNTLQKCFISTDKVFGSKEIDIEVNNYNCKYIPKFSDALSFVNKQLNTP